MQNNKKLIFEVENFIFYASTKIALLVGKTAKPLISNDKIFLGEGQECKVKAKIDILDLEKLSKCTSLELSIRGSYEEKQVKGTTIKQFTAEAVHSYNEDNQRKAFSFWSQNLNTFQNAR